MTDTTPQTIIRCSLLRRLAAIAYDTLLLFGVLLLASLMVMPLTTSHGAGPHHLSTMTPTVRGAYQVYLVLVSFAFFGWFWVHGGQTLGMKTWRIRLRSRRGGPVTPWQALLRYLMAIVSWGALGLGFLWSLVDREKLTWHDRFSMTEIEVLPPKSQSRDLDPS